MTNLAADFLKKAEKHLRWSQSKADLIKDLPFDASLEDCEPPYFELLSHTNVACEALLDAAAELGKQNSRLGILKDRQEDALLYFFWKARNAETHHILKKDLAKSVEFGLKDKERYDTAVRTMMLNVNNPGEFAVCVAFNSRRLSQATRRMNSGQMPNESALDEAGIKVIYKRSSIFLKEFSYFDQKKNLIQVRTPHQHLGSVIVPTADFASGAVIKYYEQRLLELSNHHLDA